MNKSTLVVGAVVVSLTFIGLMSGLMVAILSTQKWLYLITYIVIVVLGGFEITRTIRIGMKSIRELDSIKVRKS